MAGNGLPKDVIAFVRAHLNSVELLEVLLLLSRERALAWNNETVAGELRIQPRSAATRLEALAALGLAVKDSTGIRFNAESPLRPVVEALALAYQTHRVSIIELIFSKPPDGAAAFANAFIIKGSRGTPDG